MFNSVLQRGIILITRRDALMANMVKVSAWKLQQLRVHRTANKARATDHNNPHNPQFCMDGDKIFLLLLYYRWGTHVV